MLKIVENLCLDQCIINGDIRKKYKGSFSLTPCLLFNGTLVSKRLTFASSLVVKWNFRCIS